MDATYSNPATVYPPAQTVIYGTFWPRFAALLIDGFILSPLILLHWFNVTEWKSTAVVFMGALVNVGYKSFFEYKFGATPGKMAMELIVVNTNYERPSLQQVLLRNILQLVQGVISLWATVAAFKNPEFQEVNRYAEFNQLKTHSVPRSGLSIIIFLLYLADWIYYLADDSGKCRTLHDRIGQTYVIRKYRYSMPIRDIDEF